MPNYVTNRLEINADRETVQNVILVSDKHIQ